MQDDPFGGLMLPWRNAQKPMADVGRWGNFPTYGQTLLAHNNSIPYVLMWVQSKIAIPSLDWLLLTQAIQCHDQGEPLSGGDEHAGNKTPDKELREYLAVAEMMQWTDPAFSHQFMHAFLLQYVRKPQLWSGMASRDQVVVQALSKHCQREAIIFELTERLDYLMSAVEGYQRGLRNHQETMIDHVLRNQVPKLDALVIEWPTLATVWTTVLRTELLSLGSQ